MPILDLLRLIFNTLLISFTGGASLVFPVMLGIVMSIVYRQHSRQARLEEYLFGAPFSTPLKQTLLSLGFGILGGLFASILMIFVGLPLNLGSGSSVGTGIIFVWPVVLILMMIAPRFMCFAYGGGVVGLISLLLRALAALFPGILEVGLIQALVTIDLSSLMALVALLHLTESILILISGHVNASPIVIEKDGKVAAGFMLQRFWPLPLVALIATVQRSISGDTISMPTWWPLLAPMLEVPAGMVLVLAVFPVVAALGYSDLAVAHSPREKSRRSFVHLLVYSIILLALALVSAKLTWLQILPVLFAPLAHEYLIHMGNRMEWNKPALFAPPERGVLLLATMPDSPARQAGLDTGWLILSANGVEVNNRQDLAGALLLFPGLVELDVQNPAGEMMMVRIHQRDGRMGLVAVPDINEKGTFLKIQQEGFLTRWFKNQRRKMRAQDDQQDRGA